MIVFVGLLFFAFYNNTSFAFDVNLEDITTINVENEKGDINDAKENTNDKKKEDTNKKEEINEGKKDSVEGNKIEETKKEEKKENEKNIDTTKNDEKVNEDNDDIKNEEDEDDEEKDKYEEELYDKIEEYKKTNKEKTITTYVNLGFGTTGIYLDLSAYYLNIVGIRAEYSYFPKLDFIETVKPLLNDDRIKGVELSNKSSFGVDFSIRPFTPLTKALSGFRIDVGFRQFNGNISVSAGQDYNLLFELAKGVRNIKLDSIQIIECALNFLVGMHGAPIEELEGEAVLKIPINFTNGIKPYFGIGWDINLFKGFDLSFSLGIILTRWEVGNIELVYRDRPISFYRNALTGYLDDNQVNGIIGQEIVKFFDKTVNKIVNNNKKSLQNMLDNLNIKGIHLSRVWPVVKIGFGWQFDL